MSGGGVAVAGSAEFTMYGGSITGNTAKQGGGVWFTGKADETGGSFTVSGNARITGNTKDVPADGPYEYSGSWPSNVYLGEGGRITIGGQLTDGASIGVTLGSDYASNKVFTSGWSEKMGGDAAPARYFSSDLAGYAVETNEHGEAGLVRTAQSVTFDLNSLIVKRLTSGVPFEKLPQTEFTLTFSGGRSRIEAGSAVYDWQLTATAKATIIAGSMTERGGVYTASALFIFTGSSAQEGNYSLQNGLLTITVPAEQTGSIMHEFTITETNDGTADMAYSTAFPSCKLTSELVIDPRTGGLFLMPNSMAWTYTEDYEAKTGELNPTLENGVYRFPEGGITIKNDYTGDGKADDSGGQYAAPLPKADKGLLNKDEHTAYLTGYPDGSFRPEHTITRAEAVAMINRLLERKPESASALLPGMRTWTDNADPAKWYYLGIQEATNRHTYTRKTSGYELWQELKN